MCVDVIIEKKQAITGDLSPDPSERLQKKESGGGI